MIKRNGVFFQGVVIYSVFVIGILSSSSSRVVLFEAPGCLDFSNICWDIVPNFLRRKSKIF